MQNNKNIFNQELLIDIIQHRTKKFYGDMSYKDVPVTHIMSIYAYWKATTNTRLTQKSNDKATAELVNTTLDNILRVNKLDNRKLYLKAKKDVKNWFLSSIRKKKLPKEIDFLIDISAEKYYNFVLPIALELINRSYQVGFLVFLNKKLEEKKGLHYIYFNSYKNSYFPKIWDKSYRKAYFAHKLIDDIFKVYKKLNFPDTILVEGDNASQVIMGYFSKSYSFKSNCIQWGYAGGTSVYKLGWRNMPYSQLLTWGDFFSKSFKKQNKNLKVATSGHPLFHPIIESSDKKKRDVILFSIPKEMPPYISKEDVFTFIKKSLDFSKQNHHQYKIRFRTHPDFQFNTEFSDYLDNQDTIEIHDYFSHSHQESFFNVKYCISVGSTISLESVYYNCVPVFMEMNDIPLLVYSELKNILKYPYVIKKHQKIDDVIKELDLLNVNVNDFKSQFFKSSKRNMIVHNIIHH